jgi:hypothetical protein
VKAETDGGGGSQRPPFNNGELASLKQAANFSQARKRGAAEAKTPPIITDANEAARKAKQRETRHRISGAGVRISTRPQA